MTDVRDRDAAIRAELSKLAKLGVRRALVERIGSNGEASWIEVVIEPERVGAPSGSFALDVDERGERGRASLRARPPDAEVRAGVRLDWARELVMSIAKAGLDRARDSSAVRDAFDRAANEARDTEDVRWVGRVRAAMLHVDAEAFALLGLRATQPSPVRAMAPVLDASFAEIARETLDGVDPRQIERRYLVDLASGEVVFEERMSDSVDGTVGPSPRLLAIGSGELRDGAPRRLVIHQYQVTPGLDRATFDRIAGFAVAPTAELLDAMAREIEASVGEPTRIITTERLDTLPFGDDDPSVPLLLAIAQPTFALVRGYVRHGQLRLRPLAVARPGRDGLVLVRF